MNIDETIKKELEKLGSRIRTLREEKGMSIEEFSMKSRIRKEYLKKIEDGKAYGVMINRHLIKISEALNVELYLLF